MNDTYLIVLLAALLLASPWLFTAIHEAGHALAALLVGFGISEIRFGHDELWKSWRWRNTTFHLHTSPGGGWVWAYPRTLSLYRLRQFIVTLGGPAASAATACGAAIIMSRIPRKDGVAHLLAMLVLGTALMLLFAVLWPRTISMYGVEIPNDGLKLFRLVFQRRSAMPESARELMLQASTHWHTGRPDEAITLFRKVASLPEVKQQVTLRAELAVLLADHGLVDESLTHLAEILPLAEHDRETYCSVADSFASVILYHRQVDAFHEAEKAIRKALELRPDHVTLNGTLGGILYELGMFGEARPLLEELHASSLVDTDLGISAAYLSLIARRDGDARKADGYAIEAKSKLPDHILVKRLLDEPSAG